MSTSSLAITVQRLNTAVLSSTYRCIIMQPLFINMPRFRKEALSSPEIVSNLETTSLVCLSNVLALVS